MPDKMIIDKMLRCTAKVCKYCQDLSYDEFCGSEMLIEACVFNLSQIGELTIKLRDECKAANPQVAWAQIYGLRNRIVHDYEGVNLRLIWEIYFRRYAEAAAGIERHKKRFDANE